MSTTLIVRVLLVGLVAQVLPPAAAQEGQRTVEEVKVLFRTDLTKIQRRIADDRAGLLEAARGAQQALNQRLRAAKVKPQRSVAVLDASVTDIRHALTTFPGKPGSAGAALRKVYLDGLRTTFGRQLRGASDVQEAITADALFTAYARALTRIQGQLEHAELREVALQNAGDFWRARLRKASPGKEPSKLFARHTKDAAARFPLTTAAEKAQHQRFHTALRTAARDLYSQAVRATE